MVKDQLPDQNQASKETRQARRESRRANQKAKMLQHGKGLARVYRNAISKRTKSKRPDK